MTIYLFRSEVYHATGRSYHYGFCPLESDPERGVAGSGDLPWLAVDVPFGSAIITDPVTGEQSLRMAGQSGRLTAAEVARAVAPDLADQPSTPWESSTRVEGVHHRRRKA